MYFCSRRRWHMRVTTFARKRRSLTDDIFVQVERTENKSLAGTLDSFMPKSPPPYMFTEAFERQKWVWLVLIRARVPRDIRRLILCLCGQEEYAYTALKLLG